MLSKRLNLASVAALGIVAALIGGVSWRALAVEQTVEMTGIVKVINGGTGASTPAEARANLGITGAGTGNVNAGATLTSNSLIIGQGSQDIAVTPTGTGVLTFLGTPSGANLASALTTALPASKGGTGLTSLGTGVATALGNSLNGSAGPIGALTPTNNNCVVGDGSAWTSASCPGGGGSLTVTDGTHSVASTTTLTLGNGFVVSGSGGSATANQTVSDATKSADYSVAAGDMGNALTLTGAHTLTLPAVSSTIFQPGMSVSVANVGTGTWTLTNSTGLTIQGFTGTSISPGTHGTFVANGDATHLDFFGTQVWPWSLSIGWIAAIDPNKAIIGTIPNASTVTSIVGTVADAVGASATVAVFKAASGTACSGGTQLTSDTLNANGTANTNQTLTVTTTALSAGDHLCIVTTGGANWTSGVGIGGITVNYTTP